MDLTIAALVAVAVIVGVCCGMGIERHRQTRILRKLKEDVFREVDREKGEGRQGPH